MIVNALSLGQTIAQLEFMSSSMYCTVVPCHTQHSQCKDWPIKRAFGRNPCLIMSVHHLPLPSSIYMHTGCTRLRLCDFCICQG